MDVSPRWFQALSVGLLVAGAALLSSCSVGNQGGETRCGDFVQMGLNQQSAVIKKMLEDAGQPTSQVSAYRQSAFVMCQMMGDPEIRIKRVSTG